MNKHISQAFYGSPWALHPSKLREIETLLKRRFYVQDGAGRPKRVKVPKPAAVSRGDDRPYVVVGRVAVVPIFGVISHRMNLMTYYSGGTSTQLLGRAVDEAVRDSDVSTIVLDVDSPGGSVFGVPELADRLLEARNAKRIVAVVNPMMASAAYWLGCCAAEIVLSPSGQVGSIGVYVLHDDYSVALENAGVKETFIYAGKYKVEGNCYEPLAEEARAAMQGQVDFYYSSFVRHVAKSRGTTPEAVREGFGQGRCLTAEAALSSRLVDRIDTLDAVLADERRRTEADPLGKLRAAQRQLELEI